MKHGDIKTDELKYDVDDLSSLTAEDLVKDINERMQRPHGNERELIQSIFDHYNLMSEWPNSRRQGVELRHLGDYFQIAKEIGHQIVNVGDVYDEQAVSTLSIYGIYLCSGSEVLVNKFLAALKFLLDRYIEIPEIPLVESSEMIDAGIFLSGEEELFYQLLASGIGITSGSSLSNETWDFSLTLSHGILRYEKVENMDDFIKIAYPSRFDPPPTEDQTNLLPIDSIELIQDGVDITYADKPDTLEFDVFISYSSLDKSIADEIYKLLEENGIKPFLAPKDIPSASHGPESIKNALRRSGEILFLMFPNSLKSEWVITEWGATWVLDKPATPMLVECKIEEVPALLRDWQKREYPGELDRYVKEVQQRVDQRKEN